ncbi:FxsA family protein [Ponticoccus sp. SC2-23]|uniref:FxsA family protein n=1 Tax=Alexandriicola marinus TaxID=2081710 RepID=UPI000FDA92D2|nr:FxsA family protein [Alexandriicola marinus]MBM1220733.1 FxsA family protein [Ponticoccus sp. SC6-9]MBM1225992.1 FxsA family protein [Ponticoccus sp. SC6-15]MBM1231289.1 FxsA family protein [Ponticoccus sp. SC6-38]MBM1235850.1 FxsA family protein [Ponticoccus sp. SC6-45]MBM1240312.1 FxsA family protein [Ponticoccus sp. SC6-49]MBM1244847.1 FxsA family protein [Ponticoccus sp. SC2-64]MBM1249324.1 FxsA family protein [Ponticoccus sp. SC6-42]MBM1252388.1 FxsA family protein [Ponticoccus sp. 
MWLFLAFLMVPLIEIALFIQVGGLIGLWPTLLIVILTAIAGTFLVRTQGFQAIQSLRRSLSELDDPTVHLAHGAMILVSGALLLTPGFFTDAVGFLLLVPGFRVWVMKQARKRMNVQTFTVGPDGPVPPHADRGPHDRRRRDRVVEGEYTDVTPDKKPTHEPSGWTRH